MNIDDDVEYNFRIILLSSSSSSYQQLQRQTKFNGPSISFCVFKCNIFFFVLFRKEKQPKARSRQIKTMKKMLRSTISLVQTQFWLLLFSFLLTTIAIAVDSIFFYPELYLYFFFVKQIEFSLFLCVCEFVDPFNFNSVFFEFHFCLVLGSN